MTPRNRNQTEQPKVSTFKQRHKTMQQSSIGLISGDGRLRTLTILANDPPSKRNFVPLILSPSQQTSNRNFFFSPRQSAPETVQFPVIKTGKLD